MSEKEDAEAWKDQIRGKLNELGRAFDVRRGSDGGLQHFDSDPFKEHYPVIYSGVRVSYYYYNSRDGLWHTRPLMPLDEIKFETAEFADQLPSFGSEVTTEEKVAWIREWEAAAKEQDRQ